MRVSLCFLFCLLSSSLVDVQAGGLRILGGYVEEYSEASTEFYGKSFQWGQSEATKGNEARVLAKMYCWTRSRQKIGYCYHRLIVSTSVNPNKEHYQIVGSYQQIFDGDTLLETKYQNGVTEETPPYQKIQVAKGRTWCKVTNSYKFGDLFFFVKKTTEPSITNDISFILMNADDNNVCQEEQFWKCYDSSSERVQVAMVQAWSVAWNGKTFRNVYFWRPHSALNQCMPRQT